MSKKAFLRACACAALVGLLACAVGCAQSASDADAAADTLDPVKETSYIPNVYVDGDGDLIQITPNEDMDDTAFMKQRRVMPYNTYYVDADHRGCKSCHDDLRQLLYDSDYEHVAINGLDVEWTVDMCLGCHANGTNGYFTIEHAFATEMHGIHRDVADCWNCHDTDTTFNGTNPEMKLWDDVSHNKLRGITSIAADDMTGQINFNQDLIMDQDDLYNLNEQYYDWDYLRMEKQEAGEPLDEQMRDEWTITVGGEVERPMTFNLGDLIENAPKVTRVMKWSCMINPIGGPGVGQVEVTGIPLSYLTDQVGLKDNVKAIWPESIDGFIDPGALDMSILEGHDAIIATELNGEPLSWYNGYPCTLILGTASCGCYVKQLSNITFNDAVTSLYTIPDWPFSYGDENTNYLYDMYGWPNRDYTGLYNTPNAGIVGLKEGQVVKTGEPLTITGYADAYKDAVAAIEVSMDRGATWKRVDTTGTDVQKLITWDYTFTPEEDGAYTFAVRAIDETGKATEKPIEKMIVAHSDLDTLEAEPLEGASVPEQGGNNA